MVNLWSNHISYARKPLIFLGLITNIRHQSYSQSDHHHINTIPHFPNSVTSWIIYIQYPINTVWYKIRSQKGGQNPKIKVKNHPIFTPILVKDIRLFSCLFCISLLHLYTRCCHNGRRLVPLAEGTFPLYLLKSYVHKKSKERGNVV